MSPRPLGAGSKIDRYKVREILGMGGLGITYRAHDDKLDREVAIREYLPTAYSLRQANYSIHPISGAHESRYAQGLSNFLKVANALNQFSHNNIVKVHDVVESNNTAYMVMDCEYGVSLDAIIQQCGTLEQTHQTQVFYPIFEGLQKIHELGFVHRSIKPSNIRIREDGSPVLLDFGSARQITVGQSIESTALVNQGYMALEQYSADYGEQGPWTDIYSLAAIMYQGVTGANPAEALSRSDYLLRAQPDTVQMLSAEAHPTYQQSFLGALHAGLTLQPEKRPQSLMLWKLLFDGDLEAYRRLSVNSTSSPAPANTDTIAEATKDNISPTFNDPEPQSDFIIEPVTDQFDKTINDAEDELDISLGSTEPDEEDFKYLNAGVLSTQTAEEPDKPLRSIAAGSAAVICIGIVIGIMFLQNNTTHLHTPTDHSHETDASNSNKQTVAAVTKEPDASNAVSASAANRTNDALATSNDGTVESAVDNDETQNSASINAVLNTTNTDALAANTTEDAATTTTSNGASNSATATNANVTGTADDSPVTELAAATALETPEQSEQKESAIAVAGALPAVYFDKPIANDPQSDNPRTIAQLVESKASFPPIKGMDEQYWKEKGCSDCHNWTRASLCDQGDFYHGGDDSNINRIQHPFGGYFKVALKNWADNDCS